MNFGRISNIDDRLLDLRSVGPQKPLGYLMIYDMERYAYPDDMAAELRGKGMVCLRVVSPLDDEDYLFVFDPKALAAVLEAHVKVLQDASWPVDSEGFVRRTISEVVPLDSPVFDIIALAYGNNPQEVKEEIGRRSWLAFLDQGIW